MSLKKMFNEDAPYAFISYSHKDAKVLEVIAEEQKKFNLWWDDLLIAGHEWDKDMALPALKNSKCMIAFYSENYVKSEACQIEVKTAFENNIHIIPVSVEGMRISEMIKKIEAELEGTALEKARNACELIGHGKFEADNDKVIVVMLNDEKWRRGFGRTLEVSLKPDVYLRDWLITSEEYKITDRIDSYLADGIKDYEITQMDDPISEYAEDSGEIEFVLPLIARFRYAVKSNFKNTDYPEEALSQAYSEMRNYFEEDVIFSDFAAAMYDIACEIPGITIYMEKNGDYISRDDLSYEEYSVKVFEWMCNKEIGFTSDDINDPDCVYSYIGDYVYVMEEFMRYIERTYPNAIKNLE